MLDTARRIATPEGIELSLSLAGPVPRALAWAIDLLLRLGIMMVVAMVLGLFGKVGYAAFFLLWFFLEWLFPVWCEVRHEGATPGKRLFGLRVLHDDGTPVGWSASMTRNLLRAIDFLPFLYGFGLASMLMNRDFKRLGDLAAGTIVVYRVEKPHASDVPQAPAFAPAVALSVEEQRAIIDFAGRAPLLTAQRAEELADLVEPLVRDARIGSADRLLRIANHLIGRA